MAVAFDAATESGTWTTTPDPFTFNSHSVASGAGGLLFIVQNTDDTDDIDGAVSWGATSMERVLTMGVPGTESARLYAYWAPSIPSGVSSISIAHDASAHTRIATAISVTGTDLQVAGKQASTVMNEGSLAATRQHHIGTATAGMRFVCAYTGLGAPLTTPLSGMTAISDHDFGANACNVARETSTSTDFTIGYTDTGDDACQLALAIVEGGDPTPTLYRYLHSQAATAHLAELPPTDADDLLLASAAFSTNGGTISTPTDWTRFDNDTGSSTMLSGLFYLECDGTETGSVDFVTNISTNSTGGVHLWHIPAALRDTAQPPECTTTGPTSSGTPDPGSLTPSWGTADVHWFLFLARDQADGISSLGGNYDLHFQYDPFTGAERASSYYSNNASSEDPPSSTVGSTDEEFKAYTVGVKAPAGDQFIDLLQASETETANVVDPQIMRDVTVGQGVEQEAANVLDPQLSRDITVGQTVENELAQSIDPQQLETVTVGQAIEQELAQALDPQISRDVSLLQALEAELAGLLTPVKPILEPLGQALEAELALILTPEKSAQGEIGNVTCGSLAPGVVCGSLAPVATCGSLSPLVECGIS